MHRVRSEFNYLEHQPQQVKKAFVLPKLQLNVETSTNMNAMSAGADSSKFGDRAKNLLRQPNHF